MLTNLIAPSDRKQKPGRTLGHFSTPYLKKQQDGCAAMYASIFEYVQYFFAKQFPLGVMVVFYQQPGKGQGVKPTSVGLHEISPSHCEEPS